MLRREAFRRGNQVDCVAAGDAKQPRQQNANEITESGPSIER